MAEDAFQGDAQFTLAINGTQIGGAQAVTANNAKGATQAFSFADTLAATQDIAVSFTNDTYNAAYGEAAALPGGPLFFVLRDVVHEVDPSGRTELERLGEEPHRWWDVTEIAAETAAGTAAFAPAAMSPSARCWGPTSSASPLRR